MASYEDLTAEAERIRIEKHAPDEAILLYRKALAIGGSQDCQIKQMIGVCNQLKHEYEEALGWYKVALLEDATEFQRGNILRDMAESYSALGRSDHAMQCVNESIELLPYTLYPAEHGASLGFMARMELRMGRVHEAVRHFRF